MSLSTYTDVPFATVNAVPAVMFEARQEDRVRAALGLKTGRVPKVRRGNALAILSFPLGKPAAPVCCPLSRADESSGGN